MAKDDQDLIDQIRRGDAAALAQFFDRRRPQLLAFIDRRMGAALRGRLEPDDILQDAIVSALRALPTTQLTDRDPFGWLCQLAEQRIVDRAREFDAEKRDVHREISGHQRLQSAAGTNAELIELLAASMTSVTKAVVRNERQARLQIHLAKLSPDTQTILRQRYVEGLTTREIANALGKTDGAVRVLISRTLHELQDALQTVGG